MCSHSFNTTVVLAMVYFWTLPLAILCSCPGKMDKISALSVFDNCFIDFTLYVSALFFFFAFGHISL